MCNGVFFFFTDPQPSKRVAQSQCDKQVTLPSTVGVRRRHADRSRRRSEYVPEQTPLSEDNGIAGLEALIASPIHCESRNQNQQQQRAELDLAGPIETEEFQHSTPEPAPPKNTNQQQPCKKQTQQQPRTKPDPAARKPERGRKAERAPLKKPWENSKPRARSKSRDRSATRAKTAPPTQGNKLNTSLGFNDTFDFDCEEAVHVTPFKAKAEDNPLATPVSEEAPQKEQARTAPSPVASKQNESSSSSPSSESEDSLYVPQKTRRRQASPDTKKVIATRRGRPSRRKENIPPRQEISGENLDSPFKCQLHISSKSFIREIYMVVNSLFHCCVFIVFRDKESSPKAAEPEKENHLHDSPDSSFSNSPDPARLEQENHQGE